LELVLRLVPERDLVAQASRGDRRAFTLLHERYAPVVHAVLLARVRPQEAEDLVQEVFVKALEHLPGLRDAAALGGWLCTLARNVAADFHRHARRTEPLPADVEARDRSGSDEAARVLAAVRALPEAYVEPLLMRLVEGMTGPEIAAKTGLTPGSVRVNLHRGMKLLRERLTEGQA
jgi:RNA polymerase sigma-70 factor (ECF subfamily)